MMKYLATIIILCLLLFFVWYEGMRYDTEEAGWQTARPPVPIGPPIKIIYKTSDFAIKGEFKEAVLKILSENGVDYGSQWLLSCPKCSCAMLRKENKGDLFKGFITNFHFAYCPARWPDLEKWQDGLTFIYNFSAESQNNQVYCNKCLYPLGTDWKVVDLNEEPPQYIEIENDETVIFKALKFIE